MRVLITGGGTGGHLYPALAVAGLLKQKDPAGKIIFVGTKDGLESQIVPQKGYPFVEISAVKWPRKVSIQSLGVFPSLWRGFFQGMAIVKQFRPQAVFATGGYVSVPLVLAATRYKIPIFLHEQNSVPGLANRLLSRWAHTVFTTFPPKNNCYFSSQVKLNYSGLPIRNEIINTSKQAGLSFFGFNSNHVTLLVTGGSRGARKINNVMLDIYEMIVKEKTPFPILQIIHITGQTDYQHFCQQLEMKGIRASKIGKLIIKPYLEQMEYGLAAADVIVSRAGAATIAEITARGIPSILIPYPHATGNHQYFNALSLKKEQAAILIPESELTPAYLYEQISKLINNCSFRSAMGQRALQLGRPEAGETIAKTILMAKQC